MRKCLKSGWVDDHICQFCTHYWLLSYSRSQTPISWQPSSPAFWQSLILCACIECDPKGHANCGSSLDCSFYCQWFFSAEAKPYFLPPTKMHNFIGIDRQGTASIQACYLNVQARQEVGSSCAVPNPTLHTLPRQAEQFPTSWSILLPCSISNRNCINLTSFAGWCFDLCWSACY